MAQSLFDDDDDEKLGVGDDDLPFDVPPLPEVMPADPAAVLEIYRSREPRVERSLYQEAAGLTVSDQRTADAAGRLDEMLRDQIKQIEAAINPHIANANRTHKDLVAERARQLKPYEDARSALKSKVDVWRKAEQDLARQQALAEAARLQEQAKELEQTKAEELKAAGIGARTAKELARQEVQAGVAQAQAVASNVQGPAVQGYAPRKRWIGVIVNIRAVLKSILDGRAPATFVALDQGAIDRYAAATKGGQPVEGIVFKEVETLAGSRRR